MRFNQQQRVGSIDNQSGRNRNARVIAAGVHLKRWGDLSAGDDRFRKYLRLSSRFCDECVKGDWDSWLCEYVSDSAGSAVVTGAPAWRGLQQWVGQWQRRHLPCPARPAALLAAAGLPGGATWPCCAASFWAAAAVLCVVGYGIRIWRATRFSWSAATAQQLLGLLVRESGQTRARPCPAHAAPAALGAAAPADLLLAAAPVRLPAGRRRRRQQATAAFERRGWPVQSGTLQLMRQAPSTARVALCSHWSAAAQQASADRLNFEKDVPPPFVPLRSDLRVAEMHACGEPRCAG